MLTLIWWILGFCLILLGFSVVVVFLAGIVRALRSIAEEARRAWRGADRLGRAVTVVVVPLGLVAVTTLAWLLYSQPVLM